MPEVRLNLKPGARPTDYAVKDPDGFIVSARANQASSDLDLKLIKLVDLHGTEKKQLIYDNM